MLMPALSRDRLKALILDGTVLRQGATAIAAPSYKVSEGEQFEITVPPPIEAQAAPQDIPLTIAYEDEHLIVVDKPAGLVVHPVAGNPDGTLVNALLHHCQGHQLGRASCRDRVCTYV